VKRWALLIVAFLLVGGVGFFLGTRVGPTGPGGIPDESPPPEAVPPGEGPQNPFGIFFTPRVFSDLEMRVELAREMGVQYYRSFPVLVPTWDGQCDECATVWDAGLDFILTIRNTSDIKVAASPATDLDAYRDTVGEIIDVYDPALVVIEAEEDTPAFWSGTPEEYTEQLRAGCEAAHDRGIPCANGGLLSGTIGYLVYQHYVDTGQLDQAQSFADRAFEDFQQRAARPGGEERIKERADHALSFLTTYRDAGADYVNFHWYQSDDAALEEVFTYLQELTGLPAISNEIGQRNDDPENTERVLIKIKELGMRIAVWYAADARLARGLADRDGTLRPTGEAFRSTVNQLVRP
jgi:hypothetical protein